MVGYPKGSTPTDGAIYTAAGSASRQLAAALANRSFVSTLPGALPLRDLPRRAAGGSNVRLGTTLKLAEFGGLARRFPRPDYRGRLSHNAATGQGPQAALRRDRGQARPAVSGVMRPRCRNGSRRYMDGGAGRRDLETGHDRTVMTRRDTPRGRRIGSSAQGPSSITK